MSRHVGNTKKLKSVVSFCTGYGGLERGLELAGIDHRVVACVEIEAFVIANLVQKMESNQMAPAPVWTNVKTFPGKRFRNKVDILTGGYPCQPFSSAGSKKGQDDPRHLWPFILQQIEAIRPVQCFFENVEGHINRGLEQVISDLEKAGYDTTWGIFSAAEVGAPHKRKRVFILGNSKHNGSSLSKKPTDNLSASNNSSERPETTIESSRASKSNSNRNLQNGKPSDSNILGTQVSPKGEHSAKQLPGSDGKDWQAGQNYWSVEPNVGRVVDGSSYRVDRLRLLGNGVVPQQAAFAYTKLLERTS